MQIFYVDGILTCSFDRVNNLTALSNYFNIGSDFYILFAKGPITGGALTRHTLRGASSQTVNFQTTNGSQVEDSLSTPNASLMKAHGNGNKKSLW